VHTLLVRFFGTANFGTLNANIGTCQFQYIINISQSTSDVKTGFFPNWLLVTQKHLPVIKRRHHSNVAALVD